ncbi:MAG: hypothetical protein ACRELB_11140 [Polyangiaceae bacterium]
MKMFEEKVENTNCCHPRQADGLAAPPQSDVTNRLVFTWRENPFAPLVESASLETPVTVWNAPTAIEMVPAPVAETSFPLPTFSGRGPPAGRKGAGGAVVQGTRRHIVLGGETVKQPVEGSRVRSMFWRQVSHAEAGRGGCATADGGRRCAVGTDCVEAGVAG